jgi:hypothetical protein
MPVSKPSSMNKRNDISTPEGYFENLQQRLSEIPARPARVSTVRRLAPYVAVAASFLLIVMAGNFILGRTAAPAADDDTWTYVSYLADALDPDGAIPDESYYDWEDEESLSAEDIVNYLVADGISVEHLNYLSYEEGF